MELEDDWFMPRKKQEVQTVRVPTTLPIGMVDLITQGDISKALKQGKKTS